MIDAGLKVGDFDKALAHLKGIDRASLSSSQTLKEFLEIVDGDPALLTVGEKIVYGALPEDLVVFPLEQATTVLEKLKETYELALVSIGKREQQLLKMKNAGLDSTIFSKIMISENEDKKSSYIQVLDELGIEPTRVFVCGDRVKRDLTPAKELGCTTIQMLWGRGLVTGGPVTASNASDVDFKIHRLNQIEEIVKGKQ